MDAKWKLDHIGIAVRSLSEGKTFYLSHLGYREGAYERIESLSVEVLFLEGADNLLELIAPLPGNETLVRFLERRGEGLHHLCYEVPSVNEELSRLQAAGHTLIDQEARAGSRGMKVAFLHPKTSGSGVLIELCSH